MINLRFSRLPKHRTFNYKPVYYNEEKEELDARVHEIKREMGEATTTDAMAKDHIRRAYQSKFSDGKSGLNTASKHYTLRITAIAVILTLISYKLWNSNVLEIIFEHLKR
jgi:hypothetical protein